MTMLNDVWNPSSTITTEQQAKTDALKCQFDEVAAVGNELQAIYDMLTLTYQPKFSPPTVLAVLGPVGEALERARTERARLAAAIKDQQGWRR